MCDNYQIILLTFPENTKHAIRVSRTPARLGIPKEEQGMVMSDAHSILLNKFSTSSQYKLFAKIWFCVCMYNQIIRTPIHLLNNAIIP